MLQGSFMTREIGNLKKYYSVDPKFRFQPENFL